MSLRLSLMGSSASGLSGSSSRLEATEWLEAASDMASKLSDVLPMLPSSWLRLKRVLFSPVGPRMEFSSELTVAFPWLFRRTELWVPWIKMERLIKRQWSYVHAHKVQGMSCEGACACKIHSEKCAGCACVRLVFGRAMCDLTFAHFWNKIARKCYSITSYPILEHLFLL